MYRWMKYVICFVLCSSCHSSRRIEIAPNQVPGLKFLSSVSRIVADRHRLAPVSSGASLVNGEVKCAFTFASTDRFDLEKARHFTVQIVEDVWLHLSKMSENDGLFLKSEQNFEKFKTHCSIICLFVDRNSKCYHFPLISQSGFRDNVFYYAVTDKECSAAKVIFSEECDKARGIKDTQPSATKKTNSKAII